MNKGNWVQLPEREIRIRNTAPLSDCPYLRNPRGCRQAAQALPGPSSCIQDSLSLVTVEVSNTGHIIMFKVILKLFAGTFSPFFWRKSYTNISISHTWFSLQGSHMRSILFYFLSQLAGVILGLSNSGHPYYYYCSTIAQPVLDL